VGEKREVAEPGAAAQIIAIQPGLFDKIAPRDTREGIGNARDECALEIIFFAGAREERPYVRLFDFGVQDS
jgi:hypothetical protein